MTQVLAAKHSEELFIKRSWALDIFALAWSDIRALPSYLVYVFNHRKPSHIFLN